MPGRESIRNQQFMTSRERVILKLVAEGHGYEEIAADFGVSVQAVEKVLQNLTKKFDLPNPSFVVSYAAQMGLLQG